MVWPFKVTPSSNFHTYVAPVRSVLVVELPLNWIFSFLQILNFPSPPIAGIELVIVEIILGQGGPQTIVASQPAAELTPSAKNSNVKQLPVLCKLSITLTPVAIFTNVLALLFPS